jgi:hypothetical protein
MMISRKTCHCAGTIRVYVKLTRVRGNVTRDLDHNPKPLV